MREIITIQVGQCGNQIGNNFWQQLLREHQDNPNDNDAMTAFFRTSSGNGSYSNVSNLKARALLIDMECGPLTETMRSPLGSLFDSTQFVMDVSGAGNNFAHGHYMYGPQYREKFEEGIRKNAEECDSLQTFLVTHSLGGGTGSGVGTYVVGLLDELFPEIYRFSACVFPSKDNDVVTSPYNSTLATNQLLEHADCVLPMNNSALQAFAQLEAQHRAATQSQQGGESAREKGFGDMNGVAARMLCHLTASSRFHGEMNVDLNEICTNLIPYPRLKFLMSALSPHRADSITAGNKKTSATNVTGDRSYLQRAFGDILRPYGQLTAADPCTPGAITIASAFIARGHVPLSQFLTCVTTAQQRSLVYPMWNQEACKVGVCGTAAPGERLSVLGIYNSTAFGQVLSTEHSRFSQLFRRKAMLHHYLEYCEIDDIAEAEVNVQSACQDYHDIAAGNSGRFGDAKSGVPLFPAF